MDKPFRLGKQAAVRSMKTPAFGDYLDKAAAWATVKPRGWQYAVPTADLEMLGNDRLGDCAEAGAMHFIQVETANVGKPLHGTLQQTINLYSAVAGYDPKNPFSDVGTVLLTLLDYWQEVGIAVTDAAGKEVVHKILGYAALDTTSLAQLRYANDVFGGLYLGVQLPESAETDTSDWRYIQGSKIAGGHCINSTGQGSAGGHLMSWGMNIPFTWEFMKHYLDEAYVLVSPFWLDQQGKSPSGLDLNGLLAAMKTL